MVKKSKLAAWAVAIAALLSASACGVTYNAFKGNAVRAEGDLYIPSGSTFDALQDSLHGRIRHKAAFGAYARRIGLDEKVRGGHYVLERGQSAVDIARMLKLGLQTPVQVAVNNARTRELLAAKIARQIEADSASLAQAMRSTAAAQRMGFDSLTFYAMFLPDNYEFYWTVSPQDFVRRMKREYDAYWTEARDAKRRRSGLSRTEVMTLASIVYEETRRVDEMPRIAGVYINRLRSGMPLQADPTVKYALQDFGLRRILRKHLKTKSPYNTYINKGLPPSPICMPSKAAIEAVLNFEQHEYLFFCARPTFDGYHNFARTYDEHLRNARKYAEELNRRNIK